MSKFSFEYNMDPENLLNCEIDGSDCFDESKTISYIDSEREPKFRVGDVVENINDVDQSLAHPAYIVKDITTLIDGDTFVGFSYEVAPIDSPDDSTTVNESSLRFWYHDTNWEEYFIGNNKMYDSIYMEGVKNHMIEAGIDPTVNDPKDYIYFQEMAGRIPGQIKVYKKGKEILIIAVGDRENRGVDHFHVYRSEKDLNAWKNGACIMFTENKYFDHKDNSETLTKDELAAMINCLRSKPEEGLLGNSYWQFIINLWNGNNPNWAININTPMPDYDYKTITRYKEKN